MAHIIWVRGDFWRVWIISRPRGNLLEFTMPFLLFASCYFVRSTYDMTRDPCAAMTNPRGNMLELIIPSLLSTTTVIRAALVELL